MNLFFLCLRKWMNTRLQIGLREVRMLELYYYGAWQNILRLFMYRNDSKIVALKFNRLKGLKICKLINKIGYLIYC